MNIILRWNQNCNVNSHYFGNEVENKTVYLTLQITIFHFDVGAWDKSFRLIIIDIQNNLSVVKYDTDK